MNTKLTHFAIHIDDMERAKNFYGEVFNWGFNAYGQSDFMQIQSNKSDTGEIVGALQSRIYAPVPDKIIGLECTFNVEDIDDTIERVKSYGGKMLMPKTVIPNVGWIAKFLDTEGNLICAMQYDSKAS
ncbi:MAG: VOC family protein [Saprospiraceae bacterium]|nr:VOC family protein [Saprospiraceae bacterium]